MDSKKYSIHMLGNASITDMPLTEMELETIKGGLNEGLLNNQLVTIILNGKTTIINPNHIVMFKEN